MSLTFANVAANAEANALAALCNGGHLRIYSGARPATPDTALSGNTLLVDFTLPNPAFGSASAGVITANAITPVTNSATGTAAFFRIFESDGTTAVMDGTVGTSGADAIINSTAIQSGAQSSVSSLVVTVQKS